MALEDRGMEKHCSDALRQESAHFRRVGFLVYPDCQSLDLSGPFETFHWANLMLSVLRKPPAYSSVVIAQEAGSVLTMSGLQIVASHSYSEMVEGLDTLVVVGGLGCEAITEDSALLRWVRSIAPRTRRIVSICTGAFILARAGLLDRRRATTHWTYADRLAKAYPSIEVDASRIFVRDGNVYTSGGITAGIDLALTLVEEDLGRELMLGVARALLVFPRRPGGQSQFKGHTSVIEKPLRADVSELQTWMLAHPEADLSVPALADRMAMSERSFSRLFRNETGETPAEFAERARADAARAKLEHTNSSIEVIAMECGFGNAERMRRTFQRLFDASPAEYRARFRSTLDA
ncbi:MAG: GlxA family transcriptional regulator [Methylocystis sp.]|uniref:GlxA family transcriptional regulator n=1 Tax=Methylocystis sp. TaxID=1911079 RepID=UPI0039406E33